MGFNTSNIMDDFFIILDKLDNLYWSTIGILLVFCTGIYFSFKSNFFQFKVLCNPRKTFSDLMKEAKNGQEGQHPIKLYLASVSGMAGLGNIVAVIVSITTGGPGALFWLWIAAICGMIIKYCEIFLGVKYRIKNKNAPGYTGGPMYYLQEAYKSNFLKKTMYYASSILLFIYGVEVYQFNVISSALCNITGVEKLYFVPVLTVITLYAGLGGIPRLANICSVIGPIFICVYFSLCIWLLICNITILPSVLMTIIKSAFTGHAAAGGFVGSTMLIAMQYGLQRAVYSGDIAIGYDSIIQSETRVVNPVKQAKVAIFGVLTDSIFCTLSILVVLVTGVWQEIALDNYVATALSTVFSSANIFMTFFIFIAGWTTIIAFLAVGQKAACCIFKQYGKPVFFIYAAFSLMYFAFFDYSKAYTVMSLSGGLLVLCNLLGMIRLRNEIKFDV